MINYDNNTITLDKNNIELFAPGNGIDSSLRIQNNLEQQDLKLELHEIKHLTAQLKTIFNSPNNTENWGNIVNAVKNEPIVLEYERYLDPSTEMNFFRQKEIYTYCVEKTNLDHSVNNIMKVKEFAKDLDVALTFDESKFLLKSLKEHKNALVKEAKDNAIEISEKSLNHNTIVSKAFSDTLKLENGQNIYKENKVNFQISH